MNNGEVPVSDTTAHRAGSTKARRGGRPRKNAQKSSVNGKVVHVPNGGPNEAVVQEPAADESSVDETATRARGLLAATLRVWELKHRISE